MATMPKTSVFIPKPFDNPITQVILGVIILLVAVGLVIIFTSASFLGTIIGSIGIILFWAGFTEIPEKPVIKVGVITIWGNYITLGGHPVIVGGKTVLADYFPLYIGATLIDYKNYNKDFPVNIVSSDNVPMKGIVSVTLRLNLEQVINFIVASGGDIESIFRQLDDIVTVKTRTYTKTHTHMDIVNNGHIIARPLIGDINDKLEQISLGVYIDKVQVVLQVPTNIKQSMEQVVVEQYERGAEMAEYKTDILAAQMLYDLFQADPDMKVKPTFQQCIEKFKDLRLIRDGKVVRIEGHGNNLTLTHLNFDFGKKRNK